VLFFGSKLAIWKEATCRSEVRRYLWSGLRRVSYDCASSLRVENKVEDWGKGEKGRTERMASAAPAPAGMVTLMPYAPLMKTCVRLKPVAV